MVLVVLMLASSMMTPMVAGSAPEHGDEHAILDIAQPDYIDDSVNVERSDNRTMYEVQGPTQRIILDDKDHDDVIAYGILEGSGSLTEDAARDEYILEADGEAGTRVVYFDIEQTVEEEIVDEEASEEQNETVYETVEEIETVRHVATVRISAIDWEHLDSDRASDIRSDAANWSAVHSEAQRLDPDRDVDEIISSSFTLYQFWDSPAATFLADAQAAVIILTSRPGGLAILGLLIGVMLAGSYGALKSASRRERQFEEIEDLDETRREAYLQNARSVLSEADWGAIFPDHIARSMRDLLGDDVWLGFKRYMLMRSPTAVKGTVLQAMGAVGYTAEVQRDEGDHPIAVRIRDPDRNIVDEPISDGGSMLPDRPWSDIDLMTLDYDDHDDRAIIDTVRGGQLDLDVFTDNVIDLEEVRFPITHRDVDEQDLIDEIDPHFPGDFEDEQQLAEVLEEMIRYVVTHDHTDERGISRREMDLLAFMAELDALLCDRADFPVWHIERRILLYIADNIDPGEELQDRLDDIGEDGLGGVDR